MSKKENYDWLFSIAHERTKKKGRHCSIYNFTHLIQFLLIHSLFLSARRRPRVGADNLVGSAPIDGAVARWATRF